MNNCPRCNGELEMVSGDYGTGVFAPDGYQETQWQEGFYCERCRTYFEDLDEETLNDSVVEELQETA